MAQSAQGNKIPVDLSSRNLKDLLIDLDPKVYKQVGLFLIAALALASAVYLPIRIYQEVAASRQVQEPKVKEPVSKKLQEATTKANQDQQRKNDVFVLNSAVKSYFLKNKVAPASLEALRGQSLSEIPKDPESGQDYKYEPAEGTKTWKISAILSDGKVFELQGP